MLLLLAGQSLLISLTVTVFARFLVGWIGVHVGKLLQLRMAAPETIIPLGAAESATQPVRIKSNVTCRGIC